LGVRNEYLMTAKAYLARHGGHVTGVFLAGLVAAGATLTAAKADIAPILPTRPTLAQSILNGVDRLAVTPPPAPVESPIAFEEPLPGFAVNSPFGPRALNEENRGGRIHEGVDIAAPRGTQIHAACNGEVARTGLSPSYGNFVEVKHLGGISTFYAHMSRTAGLKVGEPVQAGEVIGFVGATGDATGPHLHFEVRKDGHHFDPALFMGHAFKTLAALPFTVVDRASAPVRESFRRTWKPTRIAYRHGGRVHHIYS
jgi:murein DD-endopeptidase MepM/ murein hydrolase activator NlpD